MIDPNGCGNSGTTNPACTTETDECALIYVFDDNQEMGECCPCFLTPDELLSISVRDDLVSNWALRTPDNGSGTIVVIGSASCSPTFPAFTEGATNLVGSITHAQSIGGTQSLTEELLFDQGEGDKINNAYLAAECGSLVGNSSGSGEFFCEAGFNFLDSNL